MPKKNLDKKDNFSERQKLPILTHAKIKSEQDILRSREIEFVYIFP